MRNIARQTLAAALGAASLALAGGLFASAPAEAKAYKCWNPAICIAVCGKPVCGSNLTAGGQAGALKRPSAPRALSTQQTPRPGRPL